MSDRVPANRVESDADSALLRRLSAYRRPDTWTSIWQVASSFGLFLAVCAAMYLGAANGEWLVLALLPVAAGAVVRIFILQHDCGHGALFAGRRANDWVGRACSLVTLTPYREWRRQHAAHHGNWNNLDRRASGLDIYSTCLTLEEYRALSPFRRWLYRAVHHPLVLFLLLPPFVFLVLYRFPFDTPRSWTSERRSVYFTNAAIAVVFAGLLLAFEPGTVAAVQISTIALAACIGTWLFHVQHQFHGTTWRRAKEWSFVGAALDASSHLDLPPVLRWFTGNIGLHHVHHLNPGIPNYLLPRCQAETPELAGASRLTLGAALRASRAGVWDEAGQRIVPFDRATPGRG